MGMRVRGSGWRGRDSKTWAQQWRDEARKPFSHRGGTTLTLTTQEPAMPELSSFRPLIAMTALSVPAAHARASQPECTPEASAPAVSIGRNWGRLKCWSQGQRTTSEILPPLTVRHCGQDIVLVVPGGDVYVFGIEKFVLIREDATNQNIFPGFSRSSSETRGCPSGSPFATPGKSLLPLHRRWPSLRRCAQTTTNHAHRRKGSRPHPSVAPRGW